MAFHDVQFPKQIAYGSRGGPRFLTTVLTLSSGKERRNQEWKDVRAEYEVAHAVKLVSEAQELREFFYARRGMAHSFRFHDHADYKAEYQSFGLGNGVKTAFQMTKAYSAGYNPYVRIITKPVYGSIDTITVAGVPLVEDTDFAVDYSTGIITLGTAPAVGANVSCNYFEFDVHARFDTDLFDIQHDDVSILSWGQIPIVELKEAD